jgi:(2Fe-2S) ferredoxin
MVVEMTSPGISPYGRHIFICANGNCANSAQVTELIQYLHQLNRQHGLDQLSNPQRIAYVKCGCLGVCSNGPIMIVYPEGIWYRAIDSTSLAQIYEEHLLGGEPVEAYILHRHYPPGQEPAYAPDLRQDQPAVPIQAAAERAAVEKEAQRRAAASEPLPDHVIAARQRRQQRRSQ